MVMRGHNCHLISLDKEDAKLLYDIDTSVQWHKISDYPAEKKADWKERYLRLKKIRHVLKTEEIDVAIGFQDGAFLSLALAALGMGIPIIAAERNSPSRFNYTKEGKFRQIRFLTFLLAEKVILQCESYIKKYPFYLKNKIKIIPNPVFPISNKKQSIYNKRKIILSVGRLAYQKNYTVLIKAFSKLSSQYPDWDLVIVGDGGDQEKLQKLASSLGVSNHVVFEGYQKNTDRYYQSSDIFCLSSLWEGFPNALAEAMSYGLPCVGFEKCDGVYDLMDHHQNGILAKGNDDPKTLAAALESLMASSEKRKAYGEAAQKITRDYAPDKIFGMWNDLFSNVKKF